MNGLDEVYFDVWEDVNKQTTFIAYYYANEKGMPVDRNQPKAKKTFLPYKGEITPHLVYRNGAASVLYEWFGYNKEHYENEIGKLQTWEKIFEN